MYDISETLPESMIVSFLEADEDCVVEIDLLLDLKIYGRRDNAIRALKTNFEEGIDFSSSMRKTSAGGRPGYSYFLSSDCFKQMCMMSESEFGREVRKYYLAIERRWRESKTNSQSSQSQVPHFYRRLQLFHERTGRIPNGYFCIFEETLPLVSQLERHGYNLPDDAVIDSSIGKLFCRFMRSEYELEPNDYCLQYPHWFPGHYKPVMANLYPIEWLVIFRSWLQNRYYACHLEKYFKGRKDASAIEAARKFLGLLPGA